MNMDCISKLMKNVPTLTGLFVILSIVEGKTFPVHAIKLYGGRGKNTAPLLFNFGIR
jgi:hypothetical protein